MDPATSKTCQTCQQQVYPRDIRSDGTCKSCARKQYYQSRKELLAERYRNNREHRLQKQREYYLKKKESKASASDKPSSQRRRSTKNQSYGQSNEFDSKQPNGQVSDQPRLIVDGESSSSSNVALNAGVDLLNGPPTLVTVSYPFSSAGDAPVTTQPMPFIIGPNGAPMPNIVTWEMLQAGNQSLQSERRL